MSLADMDSWEETTRFISKIHLLTPRAKVGPNESSTLKTPLKPGGLIDLEAK